MISREFDLIQTVTDFIVRNATELLINLNQTYLFFLKLGLVKLNRDPQQAAALVLSVASVALVGGVHVIVYLS